MYVVENYPKLFIVTKIKELPPTKRGSSLYDDLLGIEGAT